MGTKSFIRSVIIVAAVAAPLAGRAEESVDDLITQADKLTQRGECLDAIRIWSRIIRLDEKNAFAWDQRGYCRVLTGKAQDSLDDFDEVLRLEPTHQQALVNRSHAYLRLNRPDRSIEDLSTVIALNPHHLEARIGRAIALSRVGEHERALADHAVAAEIAPGNGRDAEERPRRHRRLGPPARSRRVRPHIPPHQASGLGAA